MGIKDIAIFGAGGFGREIACMINQINAVAPQWNLIGFFDDNPTLKGTMISHYGVCLGGMDDLNSYPNNLSLVIPIGTPHIVKDVVSRIENPRIDFPNLYHPRTYINDPVDFKIGKGNIVQCDCIFSCNVEIGDFNMFNVDIVFGHDDVVGSYNAFMPNVRVSGNVNIGDENFFGVGSIVLQGINIGDKVKLGAGSVLMKNPKSGYLYLGNPARKCEF